MSLKYPINVYGLRRKIFNHTVAKTYLTLKQIAQLKTYDEGYQRERDKEHEDKIIDYVKANAPVKMGDIVELFANRLTRRQVNNIVYKLSDKGTLIKNGEGKATRYRLKV